MRRVEKVVCYAVVDGHLLVFTHDDVSMLITGVQVPAGTIRDDESAAQAALRELDEETGLSGSIVRSLGTDEYDLSPGRREIVHRHFFHLTIPDADIHAVWAAGEPEPDDGGDALRWTCRWIPLAEGHVLAAGLGARLGAIR